MRATVALLASALLLLACQPLATGLKPSPSPAAGTIAAFLPEATRFVEVHRGLKFKRPVKVEYLDDETFSARLLADQRQYRASSDREAILLRATGLLDPAVDVEAAMESLLKAGVVGYYDPRHKELAVRGTTVTVQTRHVLVHELTHALQDQWFNIDTADDLDGDAEVAFKSLVEGDARRIEQMYISGLSSAERTELQHEGDGGLPAGIPPVLAQELSFPYQAGASFLQVVEQNGGQRRIDGAFRDRPIATAQVMQPARFLAGFTPARIAPPAVEGAATSQGVFGEFRLALILSPLIPGGQLGATEARAALTGWQGDHFATWRKGERDCVSMTFETNGPDGEAALLSALSRYAATRPGASVQAKPIRLDACAGSSSS